MSKKKIYKRIRKPLGLRLKTERKFLNKMGLKGWEFFCLYMPTTSTGWRIYHFRKEYNQ